MHPAVSQRRRRANFKSIEEELRYYHQLQQDLAQYKADIIDATDYAEVPAHTGPGNTVLAKVLRLRSSAAILETERRICAIEYAIQTTRQHDPDRLRLIELKYFDHRLTDEGIMEQLHVSRDTFYRWRRDFVRLVAERLGWEV